MGNGIINKQEVRVLLKRLSNEISVEDVSDKGWMSCRGR